MVELNKQFQKSPRKNGVLSISKQMQIFKCGCPELPPSLREFIMRAKNRVTIIFANENALLKTNSRW